MPLYEFTCIQCDNSFEQLMAFAAKQAAACPLCGSPRTQRVVSAPAIHFKGGGFYSTDRRAEAEAQQEKKKDKPESDGSAPKEDAGDKGKAATGKEDRDGQTTSGQSGQTETKRPQGTASQTAQAAPNA